MDDYNKQRREFLARKFGLSKLQIESQALPQDDGSRSLDEVVNDFNKEQRKGTKLKVATASTKFLVDGKPMTRLYYDYKP